MIYLYQCPHCKKTIEIVKDSVDHRRQEFCSCSAELERVFRSPMIKFLKNDWGEYQPAFGKVMKRDEVAYEVKKRNWIEIGNENINKLDKKLESEREARQAADWEQTVNEAYKET